MSDWTSGYVADIGYTYGYYAELNPLRVKLAFLNSGLVAPKFGTACELGFGQGMSVNLHASASVTQWCGTDFNPSQAAFAQELAEASQSGARLYDEAFADFANRNDLPEFDYIGLHGIWSWISDENRAVIVDFITRKLKVGGVVYISYNTQPGWAAMIPMRDLLTEHSEVMGRSGTGIVARIDEAFDFADKLMAVNPVYALANTQVPERLIKLREQNRNYLAHEYFNKDWLPMPFSHMAKWLAPTKLTYACSAFYFDHVDAINLSPEQQQLLKEIADPMFRQTVRDFMVNQQFRKDYWVKGGRTLNALDQTEALREVKVILVTHRADVSLKVIGSLGEAALTESIYAPILDALADHKVKSLSELEILLNDKKIVLAQIIQAVILLIGSSSVMLVEDEINTNKAKIHTDKLNTDLINKSRGNNDIIYLASPVTGGGINVSRFQQLFILAMQQGKKKPAEWAAYVMDILNRQGQKIVKDGQTLESAEENLAELTVQANAFAEKNLPIYKALQIV